LLNWLQVEYRTEKPSNKLLTLAVMKPEAVENLSSSSE
jgi:hypothetical protein